MASIVQWLSSTSGLLVVIPLALSIFAKAIMGVFKIAIKFKSELVTKEEQLVFEESIRRDMRGYKEELQRSILEACMRTIERELRSIEEIKRLAEEVRTQTAVNKAEIAHAMEKYEEIKNMAELVRSMNARLNRLEYSDGAGVRRSEN